MGASLLALAKSIYNFECKRKNELTGDCGKGLATDCV